MPKWKGIAAWGDFFEHQQGQLNEGGQAGREVCENVKSSKSTWEGGAGQVCGQWQHAGMGVLILPHCSRRQPALAGSYIEGAAVLGR